MNSDQRNVEIVLELQEIDALANRFKILAEPARLQILMAICSQERTVQAICDRTQLLQSNVSKHLRMMKDAGVVAYRRKGVWRYYRVVDTDLLALCAQTRQVIKRRS